ncbi:unnamed protein product [Ceratitis capitata]|uniref:(Mediterranean fruit fly) hypothetical protein n=1 Tax=Ceratitis capitata TaxID=7213 RepID=A0A811V9M1_CERCA|nr:unnamed protein product [Ceratitis capitata]
MNALSKVSLAEPVGSVKPKINVQDKLQTREIQSGVGFALLCPAQSYPTPAYSSSYFFLPEPIGSVAPRVNIESELNIARASLEPIGSVRPKVNMESELSSVRVYRGESFSLKCPAQSYPIPAYR